MKRRRQALADVNLFSFQDVMASIIGLILFIVLLMAMSIVEAPAVQDAESPPAVEVEDRRAKAAEVHARVIAAQERVAALRRVARGVSGDTRNEIADLKELERTLGELRRRIGEIEAQRAALEDQVAERSAALDVQKAKLLEQEEALTETAQRAQSRRGGPRVSYILDEKGAGKSPVPWLIELADDSIRAATVDGSTMVLEFGGGSPDERRSRFLAWAKTRDPTTNYFVLLIKPSSVAWIAAVEEALQKARFKVGSDLLPETWRPFE